jgi:DNA-directed RNA polymerase specialized sigma24 family protein
MTAQRDRRPITPEAFGKFLQWLSHDNEQAVKEYLAIRRRLVRYFIHNGCTEADELFDATVDVVAGKIDSCGDVVSQLAYCYGVARNVLREWWRKQKTVPATREFVSPEPNDPGAHEQELQCLEHCVGRLAPEEREIVTQYHASKGRTRIEARKALATGTRSANAVRVRVCRIRKDLRLCVVDCLERSRKVKPVEGQGK